MAETRRDLLMMEVIGKVGHGDWTYHMSSSDDVDEDAIINLVMGYVDMLLAEVEPLAVTLASQRAMLNNAEAVNAELMLEVANAKANAAMESDLLVQNERLGALVDQQLGPCIGCFEEPDEFCPRHGRSYTDMLESRERIIKHHKTEAETLHRVVDGLRQTIDDQSEEIAKCKILKYEAVLDDVEEFCLTYASEKRADLCGWRNAILRMREIRND